MWKNIKITQKNKEQLDAMKDKLKLSSYNDVLEFLLSQYENRYRSPEDTYLEQINELNDLISGMLKGFEVASILNSNVLNSINFADKSKLEEKLIQFRNDERKRDIINSRN